MEMKFDPMTGEPIKAPEQQEAEPGMKFDPMTGEPIKTPEQQTAEQQEAEPEMKFDPMTGKPISAQGKKTGKKWVKILGIVAVVAVVVFAGIKSGLFLKKSDKVLLATYNTLKDEPQILKDLNAEKLYKIVSGNNYTITVDGNYAGQGVQVEYASDSSQKQLRGTVDIENIPDIEFTMALDSKQLKAQIPAISSKVFTYNYKDENKDGYIADAIGSKTLEQVDSALENLYSQKEQKTVAEDIVKAVRKEYESLEFQKADKKEFEINGKDRKCKGYKFTVDEDNVANVLEAVEDILEENYEQAAALADVSMKAVFSELNSEIRNMPDMECSVYVYKNKLAAFEINYDYGRDEEAMEIVFEGGDFRTQNMKITFLDNDRESAVIELKGDKDGSTEKYRLNIENGSRYYELGSLKYDRKDGDFDLVIDNVDVSGNIVSKSNEITFKLDRILGVDGEVSVKKGSKMTKLKGDERDIMDLDEGDLLDLYRDVYGTL